MVPPVFLYSRNHRDSWCEYLGSGLGRQSFVSTIFFKCCRKICTPFEKKSSLRYLPNFV